MALKELLQVARRRVLEASTAAVECRHVGPVMAANFLANKQHFASVAHLDSTGRL